MTSVLVLSLLRARFHQEYIPRLREALAIIGEALQEKRKLGWQMWRVQFRATARLLCSRADYRSLRLAGALDRNTEARANRLHHAKIVRRECILTCAIQSQHGRNPGDWRRERSGRRPSSKKSEPYSR